MMRSFIKPSYCLLASSFHYCSSFQFVPASLVPDQHHRQHDDKQCSYSSIRTCRASEIGREKRISSSNKSDSSLEQKLINQEDKARQRREGQLKQRVGKAAKREDRISALEVKFQEAQSMSEPQSEEYMPKSERAELNGLLAVRETFEEQYHPEEFTKEHLDFKSIHNDAFIQLSRYCEKERNRLSSENITKEGAQPKKTNVFFLDGPDGGTASALIQKGGFDPSECFVANRHESSCKSLRISGDGMLPEENVVHATAAESLTISSPISLEGVNGSSAGKDDVDVSTLSGKDGAFAHIDFASYYFDGCGGFTGHIVGMISAALLRSNHENSGPIAVGYSLLGGNRNVVGKELEISQALSIIARKRRMSLLHVLDDPCKYGISPSIQKIGGTNGGTFTTWLLLQPDGVE